MSARWKGGARGRHFPYFHNIAFRPTALRFQYKKQLTLLMICAILAALCLAKRLRPPRWSTIDYPAELR